MKRILWRVETQFSRFVHRQKLTLPKDLLRVSFTFDDVHKSGIVNGGRLLSDHDAKGTFYYAMSFTNSNKGELQRFSDEDLAHCYNHGHEIGCHSYSHVRLNHFDKSEDLLEDLGRNEEMIKEIIPDLDLNHFSYPFGSQSLMSKSVIRQRYKTARGINFGVNRGEVDLMNLKAVKLYEDKDDLSNIESMLEELLRKKGWLIFYTHDVQKDYSKFGCSPHYFESVLNLCATKNIEISTIGEVYDKLITKSSS